MKERHSQKDMYREQEKAASQGSFFSLVFPGTLLLNPDAGTSWDDVDAAGRTLVMAGHRHHLLMNEFKGIMKRSQATLGSTHTHGCALERMAAFRQL